MSLCWDGQISAAGVALLNAWGNPPTLGIPVHHHSYSTDLRTPVPLVHRVVEEITILLFAGGCGSYSDGTVPFIVYIRIRLEEMKSEARQGWRISQI